ncbi:MAG: alpha-hydroxy-acid oxidizing protein [Synergistaceae bacterium]|jgi:isopentenyl diphosphate isomerase/L-lactate dehydrogenase-like FMN-dependent dehydrogenase|nr:alpha-hydroxy-acid oxidizing protein [Synergistaceae bacterium]
MIEGYLADGERKLQEQGFPSRHVAVAGNSQKITRSYIDSLLIEMRVLDGVNASTRMKVFGEAFPTPIMTAALSGMDKVRPSGMVEIAHGAAVSGAVMWCGIGDDSELEAVTRTGARTVKIIKPYADTDLVLEKIASAKKLGAMAIGMDVDFFLGPKRNRGYAMTHPVRRYTIDEIAGLIAGTKLPFVLKGILSVRDATLALEAGAAGIVVSHHGGSVFDYSVPPLMVLPKIADAIGGRIPIFADCCIGSGADAFKALALGATAVSVGRAVMAGLVADGAPGVSKVIDGITEELRDIMNLTASPDIRSIDRDVLWR